MLLCNVSTLCGKKNSGSYQSKKTLLSKIFHIVLMTKHVRCKLTHFDGVKFQRNCGGRISWRAACSLAQSLIQKKNATNILIASHNSENWGLFESKYPKETDRKINKYDIEAQLSSLSVNRMADQKVGRFWVY